MFPSYIEGGNPTFLPSASHDPIPMAQLVPLLQSYTPLAQNAFYSGRPPRRLHHKILNSEMTKLKLNSQLYLKFPIIMPRVILFKYLTSRFSPLSSTSSKLLKPIPY
ncbi:hypothetical protein KFK09_001239 [Dendrobium nobile]|uniref:Uncharacterized protein n=1 Tax=Dendrobium nobile TaxID=94219 RepID=A0A8T3C6R1_DENNO|nr:hypothetical protein KFK09_001239 [Dendrobium nobile]